MAPNHTQTAGGRSVLQAGTSGWQSGWRVPAWEVREGEGKKDGVKKVKWRGKREEDVRSRDVEGKMREEA